ncbi:MAG: flavodoxin-dependent (E)-4-hydroxy-3-methylbut-2-enyl-diphosphate synthase [Candidatus Dadabacteria bacterium]|nr:MAG: flavodoxin-dependent (E)-4-hydroxy-3-methylbut-2-enyl-diphosphate synthase [Candidatus Dadabacteria bacterium]
MLKRRLTRPVFVRDLQIGGQAPIAVQSMCATKTQDIEKTTAQIESLLKYGADLIRVAVDSKKDVEALKIIRKKTKARLVVDLQESFQLAEAIAPYVDKIRYNPGHLHHHNKNLSPFEKVAFIVEQAKKFNCALRIGINFGSIDPSKTEEDNPIEKALASALEHIEYMDKLKFNNFLVSLKSSNPNDVVTINTEFARRFPEIPLHLGVTEAGMPPEGVIKTRIAFEKLLANGIGETLRVSLTLPFEEKYKEILAAKQIINDVENGKFLSVPFFANKGLNIISCPSCSRVENEKFVELARSVKDFLKGFEDVNLTVAVMGCRVNGPGETDDADIGLWCAPSHVNLKIKGELVGKFRYSEILEKVKEEVEKIASQSAKTAHNY